MPALVLIAQASYNTEVYQEFLLVMGAVSKLLVLSTVLRSEMWPLRTGTYPRTLIRMVVLVAWLFGLVSLPASELDSKRAELGELRARMESVRKQVARSQGQMTGERQALMDVEKEIGDVVRGLRDLDRRITEQREALRIFAQERQALQADLAREQANLAIHVRAAYAMGRQGRLKIILNQRNPHLAGRVLAYHEYLSRARRRSIHDAQDSLTRLALVARDVQETKYTLAKLHDRQLEKKERLQERRAERERMISFLEHELENHSMVLERLAQDEQRIIGLIETLQPRLTGVPADFASELSFAELQGRLPWPARGFLITRFGASRGGGQLRWNGVVIAAVRGAEVQAVAGGRVVFADWLRGVGLLAIVDHGGGYMTLYGYNQSLFKEVGDWVQAGEPLASVGDSGGRVRAALYFEIRRNGRPVNPEKWCRAEVAKRLDRRETRLETP